jgi:hypothetical protein
VQFRSSSRGKHAARSIIAACAILFSGACGDTAGDEVQNDPIVETSEGALTSAAPLREDTYVRGGTYKSRNYASSTTLSVKAGSSSSAAFSLLKFDLGALSGQVKSATLRLYGSASAATIVEARRTWNSWSEGSVTYQTAPSLGDYYSQQKVATAGYYTWDVTKWANQNLGNKAASIALAAGPNQSGLSVTFNAHEAGAQVPTLSIETADSTPVDAGSGSGSVDAGSSTKPDAGSGSGSVDAGSSTKPDAGSTGGSSDAGSGSGSGSGSSDAGSSTKPDAGSSGGGTDAGSSTDASTCTPRACNGSCGTVDNGCGGTISCGACQQPTTPGKMFLGANFWRHTWGNGPGDYFKSGVNFASTTDPWQPQLISDLSYAKVLRFMDWGPTNGSKFVSWSQRVPKTGDQTGYSVPLSAGDGSNDTGEGVAYEWQIDLANRANADFWVNIPHGANDDFILQLAKLISANLNSGKKVYVEYSNEVWNYGFYQNKYVAQQFKSAGLPQNVTYQGKSVYLEDWVAYGTFRALQAFDIFEQVFGKDSPRLVKVLAGQLDFSNWPDYVATWGDIHPLVNEHMAALHSPAFNPKNIKVNAYALAPYWSGDTVAQMRPSVDTQVEHMAEAKRALDLEGSGIPLICYEGGQDGSNQVKNAKDPAIYQLTLDAYNKFKPLINGPFVTYTHVGWDGNYAWGLKQSTNATLAESHKYRATLDWAKQN